MIRKPKKKPNYEKLAQALLRRIVRAKYKDTCVVCGKTSASAVMQAGHIISRRKKSVFADFENVVCQCQGCNTLHQYEPQHLINWFIRAYGIERWEALCERAKQPAKISWIETIERLEQEANKYE